MQANNCKKGNQYSPSKPKKIDILYMNKNN